MWQTLSCFPFKLTTWHLTSYRLNFTSEKRTCDSTKYQYLPQKSIINQAVLFEDVMFISGAIFYFGGVS